MIEIISGDLLDSKEKYIVHQTNCISTGSAGGIARLIFDKYPYADTYKNRIKDGKTGTIEIFGDGKDQRFIINSNSQFYPGYPKFPDSEFDGLFARQRVFYKCLLQIAKIQDLESIAFPFKIGCGLGGGDWEWYFGTLKHFADYVKTKNAKVFMYKREGDE